jgi:peptide/nickel transport system substrate-binding protein
VFGRRAAGALTALLLSGAACLPAVAQTHRGGTLHLVAHAAAGTLDPQINYTLEFWQIEQATYDGLLAFRKAAGVAGLTIVPDLAEAVPPPQDGGKTYTFTLRRGITFSDGTKLSAEDVAATFRRIFKVSSPTAGTFFNGIVGADACLKTPKDCALPGVVADDAANTVTFHLTQPDPEFFDKLAVQHALIVPHSAPAKDVGVTPLPGTGAYMIAAFDPNKQMKVVRNPHFKPWSADAQPDGYPDEIDYDFGLPSEDEINAVEKGQADWTFEPPPGDRLRELGETYAEQIHISPLTEIYYASMNTNIPPFNSLKARLAVNHAIDRAALVKLFGGPKLATPSCQILPPGIDGYVPYCPFGKSPGAQWSAPDMEKARQLVQESGTMGQSVTVIVDDGAVGRGIGTYLVGVLKSLGYKASVHSLSSDVEYTYIQNSNNKMQIGVSFWSQDYPAPSDFLNVLYSCASFHPGSDSSINMSGFCDHEIDAEMQKALTADITDTKAGAKIWADVDRKITDQAPAAVLYVPKQIDFVSKRVGHFTFNPQDFFIVSQAWVK